MELSPNQRIEKLSLEDRKILNDLLTKDTLSPGLLFMLAGVVIFIFLPGRHNRPSFFSQYGFIVPFLIISSILSLIIFYADYQENEKLKKDLESDEKVVEIFSVIDKDSNNNDEYFIGIDTKLKDFKKYKIIKDEFQRIKIGHGVTLEYAKFSETVLKIIL
jgi:hypothetical protein